MKRILLVKTSSLGDVIHNLPVVNDILQQHAEVEIDWVVEESFADIPALHPSINRVYQVAVRRWRKQLFKAITWQEISAFKQAIAETPYDIIIDTQGLLKSALMTRLAKGERHGYDQASAREPIACHFYDNQHTIAKAQHAVKRNRALVAKAIGYANPETAPDYGIHATESLDVDIAKPWVIGLHGTSRDSKLWPTQHWQSLAQALRNQHQQLLLPWVSNAEKQRATLIAQSSDNVTVLPKLSIAKLAAIIQQCKTAIGVDTGLSHLAAALNIPTIALYTDTQPALTGVHPGAHAAGINLGGVNQIPTVETVLAAMQNLDRNRHTA